jgi:hypothetical protein
MTTEAYSYTSAALSNGKTAPLEWAGPKTLLLIDTELEYFQPLTTQLEASSGDSEPIRRIIQSLQYDKDMPHLDTTKKVVFDNAYTISFLP